MTSWHTVKLRVPFPTAQQAVIAKRTIEVDEELQPNAVKRTIEVEDDVLVAEFQTLTVRLARLTVNAFLENVDLVVRTMAELGPGEAPSYT
ncbi:CTAG/Pcc1 family [Pterulicium gracile]|uniref:CTAG/Pcc1 family n=1 Tax=Pterulicium gracile TaxID=1884261 RepID=A0A5C3QQY7_9AGAR|nr:CTAG/Pcc1 family [Pterula gracilis]